MLALESFQNIYSTDSVEATVGNRKFTFFIPKIIDNFIDRNDVTVKFPLWAKIWESSMILADCLAEIPAIPGKRILEIGAGIGIVGIIAANFGHRMTLTEYDPHALDFARANAVRNACEKNVSIVELDWNSPKLDEKYDCIVGSEFIYHERDIAPLLKLFQTNLKSDGEIILAMEIRKTLTVFLREIDKFYSIKIQKKTLRSLEKEFHIVLCRMKPKFNR